MKLIPKKTAVLVLLPLVCIFAFAGCGKPHVIDSLKRHRIDTELLNENEMVCDIKGETFTGRAPSYGVLVFENEPTDFLQSFSTEKSDGFSSDKNEKFENLINSSFSDLKLPNEFCPDWNEKYIWFVLGGFEQENYSDTLFMIYFPDDLKLIVYETGH